MNGRPIYDENFKQVKNQRKLRSAKFQAYSDPNSKSSKRPQSVQRPTTQFYTAATAANLNSDASNPDIPTENNLRMKIKKKRIQSAKIRKGP